MLQYGGGKGPVHLRTIQCNGNESNLLQCAYRDESHIYCVHLDDLGVSCGKLNGVTLSVELY